MTNSELINGLTKEEWEGMVHVARHLAGVDSKILWYDMAERRLYVQPGFSKNVHFIEILHGENDFDIHTAVLFMQINSSFEIPICDCLITSELYIISS